MGAQGGAAAAGGGGVRGRPGRGAGAVSRLTPPGAVLSAEGRPLQLLPCSLSFPGEGEGGGDDARPARPVHRARPRSHACRRALVHLPAGAVGQHAGHVRGGRGRAQVLQA